MKVQCVLPRTRTGIDESGRGDYFSPLIIAAIHVDAQREPAIQILGIGDSKEKPTDKRMREMAQAIKNLCLPAVVVTTLHCSFVMNWMPGFNSSTGSLPGASASMRKRP